MQNQKIIPLEILREIAKKSIDMGFNPKISKDCKDASFDIDDILVKLQLCYDSQIIKIGFNERKDRYIDDIKKFQRDLNNATELAEMLIKERDKLVK
jgi:hypothetical protein